MANLHLNEHGACETAFRCCEEANALFELLGDISGEAGVLDTLGRLYTKKGDTQTGINLQLKALRLSKSWADPVGKNRTLGNLGISYAEAGNHKEAINYFTQQYKIAWRINDRQS